MKSILPYSDWIFEKNTFTVSLEELLNSITLKEINPRKWFKKVEGTTLPVFGTDPDLLETIDKKGMNIDPVESTTDFSEWLDREIWFQVIRYGEKPKYLLLQEHPKYGKETPVKMYWIQESDLEPFYRKLTDKTLVLTVDNQEEIWKTTNGGGNWEKEGEDKELRIEDIKSRINKAQKKEILD